jgi:hypothetical protein
MTYYYFLHPQPHEWHCIHIDNKYPIPGDMLVSCFDSKNYPGTLRPCPNTNDLTCADGSTVTTEVYYDTTT